MPPFQLLFFEEITWSMKVAGVLTPIQHSGSSVPYLLFFFFDFLTSLPLVLVRLLLRAADKKKRAIFFF